MNKKTRMSHDFVCDSCFGVNFEKGVGDLSSKEWEEENKCKDCGKLYKNCLYIKMAIILTYPDGRSYLPEETRRNMVKSMKTKGNWHYQNSEYENFVC